MWTIQEGGGRPFRTGTGDPLADPFLALAPNEQDSVVEFLRTLQLLPEGTSAPVIDERGRPRQWPPSP